jgi:nucleoside phosphorylase
LATSDEKAAEQGSAAMSEIDVVVVTAMAHEYEAAIRAASAGTGTAGVSAWTAHDRDRSTPYLAGRYTCGDRSFTVAIARATRAGQSATASVAASLVERLRPRCLAMCGVCAGNPAEVALGDVIVADLTFGYDEGKRTVDGLVPDHRHLPMPDAWVRAAQDLSPRGLPSHTEPTGQDSALWFLERLYRTAGDLDNLPWKHPAWRRYVNPYTWHRVLHALESRELLAWTGDGAVLTRAGRAFVQRNVHHGPGVPPRLPFAVAVGPIASGAAVVDDGRVWRQLEATGVRPVLGVEMEAAGIATVAHRLGVPAWAVVKGVADHADTRKDDRYAPFAATAAAEVLWRLLADRLLTDAALTAKRPRGG